MDEPYRGPMVRFLEGTEGFSEYRPQNIGMDFDARIALSAMRTARMMIGTEQGASIFIESVEAAEQRFWAYLRTDKKYIDLLKKHATDPHYRVRDYSVQLQSAHTTMARKRIADAVQREAMAIEIRKAKEKAFVIMIWSRYAGLDITSQSIPESILPDEMPIEAMTPEEREDYERKRAAAADAARLNGAGPVVSSEPKLDGHD